MRLKALQSHWDRFGTTDPLYAILTCPGTEHGRWNDAAFMQTGRDDITRLLDYMAAHAMPVSRGRALDFGCGVGRLTHALAEHFAVVDGIDIAPSMIALANQRNPTPERVHFHLNSRPDLATMPSSAYDLVYSFITLHHMEPRYALSYIEEFVRLLAPTGLAVFHVVTHITGKTRIKHAVPWLVSLYRRLRYGSGAVMEAHALSIDTIARTVDAVGGHVVHVQTGLGSRELPGAHVFVRRH